MSLLCVIKAFFYSACGYLARFPKFIWDFIIKEFLVAMAAGVAPIVLVALLTFDVSDGVRITALILSAILAIILMFVVMGASDFRMWARYTGKKCTEETFREYLAFKKALGWSYVGSAFHYDFTEMKYVPREPRD